ncbi:hypothetical protein B1F79_03540 [Coxiella-like endosymbiont of Rhipicephalus sanguineus]|nr:hypothetical protein [Coxiella-like endosymbiont of Rhipicephalus sanguineus]
MNYACQPNFRRVGPEIEVAIRRDIRAGEEITCDYSVLNLLFFIDYYCEHLEFRGRICGEDILLFRSLWNRQIKKILPLTKRVYQPFSLYIPYIKIKKSLR